MPSNGIIPQEGRELTLAGRGQGITRDSYRAPRAFRNDGCTSIPSP